MKKIISIAIFALLIFTFAVEAKAETSLKVIMLKLQSDMETIVGALGYDNFDLIEKKAMEIADHEKAPLEERKRIMAFLKEEGAGFKKHDDLVHSSAVKVAEAAAKKDYDGVIENYAKILKGCTSCHTNYRSRIMDLFEAK